MRYEMGQLRGRMGAVVSVQCSVSSCRWIAYRQVYSTILLNWEGEKEGDCEKDEGRKTNDGGLDSTLQSRAAVGQTRSLRQ